MESEKLRNQIAGLKQLFFQTSSYNAMQMVAVTIKELKIKLEALEKAEKLDVYKVLTEVKDV
jgi:hypothetical protein